MATELDSRNYQFNYNNRNSNGSFREHDRQMREFRRSHADVALVNGLRVNEAALLESLLFLRVNYIVETGGSAFPDYTTDQPPLVPIWKVARYKLSQT
jgi:hypothetical protein